MTAITKSTVAIFLLLSTVGSHADARLTSVAIETLLKDVIIGHYYAIAENRLEEAVRFYHSDSPDVARIRTELELNQEAFLQKTTTLEFTFVGHREDFAFGEAKHRFLRIAGIKFSEEFVDASYVFRKEDCTWKLWMTRMIGREPPPTKNERHRTDVLEEVE